ncbi:replication protein A 70 kDa DNA-binding subunit-like [Symsagittifera roscoffensis]|uniref:replication protein A 70 kDa DNA-binding subunit-like n=1 Tax=Symsagittifera roscoffensis TaxID=84072 RepID=UPI00307B827F
MSVQLSTGAIDNFAHGVKYKEGSTPVTLQILNSKKMVTGGNERFRILISDGVHSLNAAMLSPSLNHVVELQQQNCVFTSNKYNINTVAGDRKIVVFMDAQVVKEGHDCERIGRPTTWTRAPEDNTNTTNSTPSNVIRSGAAAVVSASPQHSTLGGGGGGRVFSANPTTPLANRTGALQLNSPKTPGGGGSSHPIVGLNPYQNKWVIKARCMNKGSIRNYNNAKGPGKLFNFEVADSSGEIRITGFNDQVDKFYDMIEPEKVYLITGCSVKAANKQYNKTGHDYELTLTNGTLIEPMADDGEAPKLSYNFQTIDRLLETEPNSVVDVIGIVQSCEDCQEVTSSKTQKSFVKRELNLLDRSEKAVRITLWGGEAEKFVLDENNPNPVMAIKGAVVKDFGGRSLSMGVSSSFIVNPDIPEAHQLSGWFSEAASTLKVESVSNMAGGMMGGSSQLMSIEDAREARLGMGGDKADYYTTKATFVFFKKDGNNVLYPGCKTCRKKLVDEGNGFYRCEKCVSSSQEFNWHSVVSANIADHSDNLWVTLFNESAELVLATDINELGRLKQLENEGTDESASTQYNKVFSEANFKSYLFKIRVKMESYNDETRLKSSVVQVSHVNPVDHAHNLLKEIEKLSLRK